MKYSISLDLLLASAQASLKGKHKSAAKFYDAALRAKDFKATIAALEKSQTEALASLKKAKTTAAPTAKKPATTTETAGQRMTSFLQEIAKNREEAAKKSKKATKKMAKKKKVKANPDTEEFNNTIDNMTQANSVDSVLDPALDLVDDGEDGGGGNPGEAIPRETPSVTKTEEADIGDPSNGMGESELDTDLDDAMDLDDLTDLSEEDFLAAADEDLFDDSDENLEDDVEMASDDDSDSDSDSDDSDDSDDDSDDSGDGDPDSDDSDDDGGNPFDKQEGNTKPEAKSAKAGITRTIHNLAALDRLTAMTSMLVEGKKPVKASAKPTSTKSAKPAKK